MAGHAARTAVKRPWSAHENLDIDGECVTKIGGRRVHNGDWYPLGPQNLSEVVHIVEDQVRALLEACDLRCPAARENLKDFARRDMVITSSYSGAGTFEVAVSMYMTTLSEQLGLPSESRGKVSMYAAWDISKASQKVLRSHRLETRPKHLFGDLTERLEGSDRDRLAAILSDCMEKYQIGRRQFEDGFLTLQGKKDLRVALGRKLVLELSSELESMEFKTTAWCLMCKNQCPISPRWDPEFKGTYWCEAAGTNCQPFSTANHDAGGWLDESTLIALVWVYSMRYFQPDTILRECVVGASMAPFEGPLAASDVVKCPRSASVTSDMSDSVFDRSDRDSGKDEGDAYTPDMRDFSPRQIGLPVERRRRYERYNNAARLQVFPRNDIDFKKVFFRCLACDLSVFASQAESFHKQGQDVALTAACEARIEGYLLLASKKGLLVPTPPPGKPWLRTCVLVDAEQDAGYGGLFDVSAPTLLKRSRLYDIVQQRLAAPAQHWLMQGFPYPCDASGDFSQRFFPFLQLVVDSPDVLTEAEQRQLTGNGMHVAQIGSWFLYNLACVRLRV
jgi:hypothetical protein